MSPRTDVWLSPFIFTGQVRKRSLRVAITQRTRQIEDPSFSPIDNHAFDVLS